MTLHDEYRRRIRRALIDPIMEQLDDPPTSTSGTEHLPFDAPAPRLDSMPPSLRSPWEHAAELVVTARDMYRPGIIDELPEAAPDAEQPALLYTTTPISSRASIVGAFRRRPRIAQALDEADPAALAKDTPPETAGAGPVERGERTPWLGLDLDGTTLAAVAGKLPSGQPALGEPLPGVVEFVAELRALGWRVSTFTARFAFTSSTDLRRHWAQEIAQHLAERGVQVSDVWYGPKAPFHRIVDDRAVRFAGDFRAVLAEVTALGYGGEA